MVKILQREGLASWEIVGYRISPGTKQFIFAQLYHIFSFTYCKSTSVRFVKIILDHHKDGLIEQLFFQMLVFVYSSILKLALKKSEWAIIGYTFICYLPLSNRMPHT